MNRIYRVVWSKVKDCYVVVSELAGTAKKSGRVRADSYTHLTLPTILLV